MGYLSGCGRQSSERSLADRVRETRAFVEDLHARTGAPGLSAAVAVDGEVVWSEGFGVADVERQVPATAQTIFRIGSVSKVLTAAAVARLVQSGELNLDDPVQRYVPEFPDKGYTITTRHLTGHLSGVRHYRWDETRPTRRYGDVIEALDLFKDDPLEFPPGSRFSYSSYGWVLVSAVVQRAAGKPFLEYMQSDVFEPLGMGSTGPESNDFGLRNRAGLYDDGRPVAPDELSYIWAAGGFVSTVEDLVRFGSAFLPGGTYLEPATLEALFTPQAARDGKPTRFGVGWMVDGLTDGTPVYYHVGTVTGGHAVLLVNPRDRIVVAMLANQESGLGPMDGQRTACRVLGRSRCPDIVGESERRATKATEIPALLGVLKQWEQAMEDGGVDDVLATLSPSFRSPLWSGRSDLEESLRAGGIEIDAEDIHVRSAGWDVGAVVRVEGVKVGSDPPLAVVLQVVREESGWKITSIEPQE